ncbi:bifunctional heptose 7-phosphate kinase/heptose 1-phosphate adenyltransferase [Thermoleptolyngbya sp. M55_K2018_002]|uniref:bifunctional heptose 7-phosphate kinase/heptose 1-phosphate adenyltransferase n=1 Tax=Thermoleptolyngbya sp. M55_K2018_002 TaxID=2747808 RepID=UPI0019ECCE40|nr:PfkB family carbohydrate kinase [Thermoleptolyngbya sp. M55_K2018_002]HIK42187.1 bifunctional hydroxymethylpyrimidine kinase/phosphomethylpyrimidine kinase [Thermoleptolyngbya sp. M55_K2018_002]
MVEAAFLEHLRAIAPRLNALMDRFTEARVMVAGDLTLDEFLTGQVERLSREAPVLILRHEETRQIPGGGANAVYNLAKLGAQVKAVGLVGKDEQGAVLRRIFEAAGIDTGGILLDGDRPTVTKTRISGHARQSVTQQIVRVDRKSDAPADPDLQLALADYIRQHLNTVDAVVCSDYGDGVLSAPVIEAALQHSLCVVDTQIDLHRFAGATVFTPNLPEAEKAVGYGITGGDSRSAPSRNRLAQAGADLLRLTRAQHMLITRGEEGMSLFSQDGSQHHVPAFNRTDVFDVTGAGDTVVAALTLGLIVGATPVEAAILGNLAASIVVRQFGTATTSVAEMKAALRSLVEASQ